MSYKPRDRIFAKVKGHPHWPSRVNILPEDVKVPKGKFPIFFYGTHEVYFLGPKDIFPYDKWKHKYSVNKTRPVFQKGLDEIENNPDILLYGTDPNSEEFLSQFYDFQRSTQSPPLTKKDDEKVEAEKKDEVFSIIELGDGLKEPTTPSSASKGPKEAKKRRLSSDAKIKSSSKRDNKHFTRKKIVRKFRETKSPSGNDEPEHDKVTKETFTQPDLDGERQSAGPPAPMTALGRPVRKSASQFSAKRLLQSGMAVVSDEDSCHDADWNPLMTTKKRNTDNHDGDSLASAAPTDPAAPEKQLHRVKLKKSRLKRKPSVQNDSRTTMKPQRQPSSPSSSSTSSTDDASDSDTSLSDLLTTQPLPPRLSRRRRHPSPPSLSSSRLKHKHPRRDCHIDGGSPIVSSTTSSLKDRLKIANVSMSPEELQDRLANKRLGQKTDQLKELGAEARLHFIDRAIKVSLIRGQEDIPACIQRMESLEKMNLTLPVLVKCNAIIETVRKCCRYKPSLEVKIAALKVFNRFMKIQANASRQDLEKAHAELMESNKRAQPTSASHTPASQAPPPCPQSLSDLFQLRVRPPAPAQQQEQPSSPPPPPQASSVELITTVSPLPGTQVQVLPPLSPSHPPTSVSPFGEVTSTTAELAPPPPPPPPPSLPKTSPTTLLPPPPVTPPRPPTPPAPLSPPVLPLKVIAQNDDAEDKNSSSESEGLAPSIGGDETASDSDDEPFAPLSQQHPHVPPPNTISVEATLAAVKQAFLLRTRDKPPTQPSPQPQRSPTNDAYVPRLLNSGGASLPAYISSQPPPIPSQAYIPLISASPPEFPPFTTDLSRPPPPIRPHLPQDHQSARRLDPRLSPEQRRRVPPRQRVPSPHALPHPLEHYQRFLNGEPLTPTVQAPVVPNPSMVTHSGDDLDARIARLLGAAAPPQPSPNQPSISKFTATPPPHPLPQAHRHFPTQPPIASPPPPPPPPLPPSQNLILAHRPNGHQQVVTNFSPASPILETGNGPNVDSINMLGGNL